MKHILNDCRNFSLSNLELTNYVISKSSSESAVSSENFNFLKQFSEKNQAENVSLVFKLSSQLQDMFCIFKNLISKHSKNLNLTFYLEDYMNIHTEEELRNNKEYNLSKADVDLINFKISLINTNLLSEKIYTVNELYTLPKFILYSLMPEFLEINYIDIMNNRNSKIEKDVFIFRISKVIYTKKFFCLLNSLKSIFNSPTSNFNHRSNAKIFKNISQFLSLKDEDMFEIKTHHLRIMLNLDRIKSSTKFMFNLVEDYLSIIERKKKYEN